jgi:hypothetical protein
MTVNQVDGHEKVPALPTTFAKAAPVAEAASSSDEPVKEPTKRETKKVESKSVASVLDEWADDAE